MFKLITCFYPKKSRSVISGLVGFLFFLVNLHAVQASHNLAGQITASYQGNNSYEITLTTYTDPAPQGVDRCSATIEIWSTGSVRTLIATLESIPRANGPFVNVDPMECPDVSNPRNGVPIYNTVKRNIYITQFTFPGPGRYELRYYDVARREDVVNMADPGSTAFYVETQIFIPNPIIGKNNTPILLNDPLDEACAGELWSHNPGGFDPDGDSLVYRLRESFQYEPPQNIGPEPVNQYRFPDDANAFNNGPLTMDPQTGLMTWRTPVDFGTYNIAYIVEEYRNGVLLGYVVRDMAIIVTQCDNDPPVIETIQDTCVIAGETLRFEVKSFDPNPEDSLYLSLNTGGFGQNGPFFDTLSNPAEIGGIILDPINGNVIWNGLPVSTENNAVNGSTTIDTIRGEIVWSTACENIRTQEYQIDFFAHDNDSYIANPANVRLTDNKIVRIKVIPPPPTGLQVTKTSRQINLSWDRADCDNVLGYQIYRKVGETPFMQDTICCQQSPLNAGYELLSFVQGRDADSFIDSLNDQTAIFEVEFCYVITAMYGEPSTPNIPLIESCATEQVCVSISNDALLMTNDSVAVTDPASGSIFLSWSAPDTIDPFFPPPYEFKLYRGPHNQEANDEIATLSFGDTTYFDTNIDTESQGYNYRVELIDNLGLTVQISESADEASSIFLQLNPGNQELQVSWKEFVPWFNSEYELYRSEDGGNTFNLLTIVAGTGDTVHTYLDAGLMPDVEYCYFVRSIGSYQGVSDVKFPLINDSQIACSIAQDTFPPCFPEVVVLSDCAALTHTIQISKQADICDDDGLNIDLQFADSRTKVFNSVLTIPYNSFGTDTTIVFDFNFGTGDVPVSSFAGCYAVITSDTIGNTSVLSEEFCVEFCPSLELGNVFSPNGDGINDTFRPVDYRDVVLKEFRLFDRWGRLLHTNNTSIDNLWDGRFNGQDASEGVYYYYIQWEELNLGGGVTRDANGWVTLLR